MVSIWDRIRGKPIKEASNFIWVEPQKSGVRELGKSLIPDTLPKISKEIGEQHPFDFRLYESSYLSVPIIAGAIDKTVDFIVGEGFYVISEDATAQKAIEDFIRKEDFDTFLRTMIRNQLIHGSAFCEIIGNGKDTKLKVLDPKYIYIKRDKHGEITGYSQYFEKGLPIDFKPEDIVHFPINQTGDQIYGTSMLRPLFGSKKVSLLEQFLKLQEAMKNIVDRRANSPWHVKIGNDQYPATAADVSAIADQLIDLTNKNELVTTHLVSIDVLQHRGRILDIEPFLEHYENNIIYALQVPAVLLGRANVPEGIANVQMEAFDRRAKSHQSFIEKPIEEQIFKRVTDVHVDLEWGSPESVQGDGTQPVQPFKGFKKIRGPNANPAINPNLPNPNPNEPNPNPKITPKTGV
jgi:hypothetical protein